MTQIAPIDAPAEERAKERTYHFACDCLPVQLFTFCGLLADGPTKETARDEIRCSLCWAEYEAGWTCSLCGKRWTRTW